MLNRGEDLRCALRRLMRAPGFTVVAILTLGVGIGATTIVASLVEAVLLRPLPYPKPDRLVHLLSLRRGELSPYVSYPNFADYASQEAFSQAALWQGFEGILTGIDERPDRLSAATVSIAYFDVLDVQPAVGRFFLQSDQEGKELAIVVSHGFWQRRLGGIPSAVGRTLSLVGYPATIVGVTPAGFQDPLHRTGARPQPEVWLAMRSFAAWRGINQYLALARLKAGLSIEAAQAALDNLSRNLALDYPESNQDLELRLVTLKENLTGGLRPAGVAISGAVLLLLAITCVNVSSLQLSRSGRRRQEIALRGALGANRFRLLALLSTESLILSALGGIAGLALAWTGTRFLATLEQVGIPRAAEAGLEWTTLLVAAGTCLLVGILCGLVPAWAGSRPDLRDSLAGGTRGATAVTVRLRSVLVVAETALSLVLLIGAALLAQSFANLQDVDPGLDLPQTLTLEASLLPGSHAEPAEMTRAFRSLLERISGLPGVRAAGAVSFLPMSGAVYRQGIYREDLPEPEEKPGALMRAVMPGYFQSAGIPLLRGRPIQPSDEVDAPRVAVIDQSLQQALFGSEECLGQRVNVNRESYLIVGVSGGVKQFDLRSESDPSIYVPYAQESDGWLRRTSMFLTIGIERGDPHLLAQPIRELIRREGFPVLLAKVQTMRDIAGQTIQAPRAYAYLTTLFAAAALLLAAVGVGGVTAYNVSQRTKEIGVHLALGARRGDVLFQVVGQGMRLASWGLVLGLLFAAAFAPLLSSLLFGVASTEPAIYALVTLLLGLAAFFSCLVPAYRASCVDPMRALRGD